MEFVDKKQLLKICKTEEERLAFSRTLDVLNRSLSYHENAFTDFIDPHKAALFISALEKISDSMGFFVCSFGGMFMSERIIIGFCPDYRQLNEDEFPLIRIKISFDKRYAKSLTHRDFLGAIMGLSIERGKIGDIITQNDCAYVIVKAEMANELVSRLTNVGSASVFCEKVDFMNINSATSCAEQKKAVVASPRIDGIISHCFHLSRRQAAEAIRQETVFVNWTTIRNASTTIAEGDIITLRGVGRIEIKNLSNRTKKDRYIVEYLLIGKCSIGFI